MKKLFLITLLVVSTNVQAADKYIFDKSHTNIVWQANHFGFSNPNGQFVDLDGSVMIDEKSPDKSSVEAVIKIPSLWTPTAKFTEHLLSKDFFNAEQYPEAKFKSTSVKLTGKNVAEVTGDFTLLGVTKPLLLNVTLNNIGKQPYTQKQTAGFSANAIIKRSDYGMTYAIPGVSDEVKIQIETEVILEKDTHEQLAQ